MKKALILWVQERISESKRDLHKAKEEDMAKDRIRQLEQTVREYETMLEKMLYTDSEGFNLP